MIGEFFFRALKFLNSVKRGILEEYKSELFSLNKVSCRFLTTGVLCRAYMETSVIVQISVKDPHYSLTVGRNSIGGMCLDWGQDNVWRNTVTGPNI